MTAEELIKLLSEYPKDIQVCSHGSKDVVDVSPGMRFHGDGTAEPVVIID